ncbi:alanine racemase [Persicirhabdus sediminis]|uniref:Alanine racemase n=1 Tax=Persicirhabdus sediminis TaxID=454144 RepID=A0A8J7MDN5_9BACT|nr:alanine racemase [Persicirhabdus sediminis]
MPSSPPRTWAEIDLAQLRHNLNFAKQHSGMNIMAIMKAGAYGHGAVTMAKSLEDQGLSYIGVASVIEARKLTQAEIQTPIYLLGPTFPDEREEIVYHGWTASISNLAEAHHFSQLNQQLHGQLANTEKKLPVHLTVDTGMGRGGFLPAQLVEQIDELRAVPNLIIEGIGSHLPSADEDREFTLDQFARFDQLIEDLGGAESFKWIHLSNSAGLLDFASKYCNLCRPGLMLYGISPLPDYQSQLTPVMALKSRVSIVRELPAGHSISYGRSAILEKDSRVATVGAGYGDGFPRALSNVAGASVMIDQTECPILGRVTMDQIMVDVSHLPQCQPGDEVELFGENKLVSEVAAQANTIAWDVLTGITPRVTRIYKNQA